MMVSNPCNPDYRVVKEAESLAAAGYEVRVFCTWKPKLGLPMRETINGVTYERYEWNPLRILREMLPGSRPWPEIPDLPENREQHRRRPIDRGIQ